MYNLFGQLVIDYDFNYSSKYPSIILSEKFLNYNFINDFEKSIFHESLSLEAYINREFNGSQLTFWKFLKNKSELRNVHIYLSFKDYLGVLLLFWKSVFKNVDDEHLHLLYQIHIDNFRLNTLIQNNKNDIQKSIFNDEVRKIDKTIFLELSQNIQPLPLFDIISRASLNYELLLGNYLYRKENWNIFEKKINNTLFKFISNEILALKVELSRSIFENLFSNNLNEANEDYKEIAGNLEYRLRLETKFQWLFQLEQFDSEYLSREIDIHNLLELYNYSLQANFVDNRDDKIFEVHQKILLMYFEKKYEEILEYDIERMQGTILFDSSSEERVNLLLISYLYNLKRFNKNEDLKKFELHRVRNGF